MDISKRGNIQSKLQDVEAQLETREQEIAKIRQKILSRIKQQTEQACKFITLGMTQGDVKSMLGEPAGKGYNPYVVGGVYEGKWTYGTSIIWFNDARIVDKVECKN